MALRLVIDSEAAGKQYQADQQDNAEAVPQAMKLAGAETAEAIETEGRADISSAGRFGSRWREGFKSTPAPTGDGVVVTTTMSVGGWKMFQQGRTIHGRPLLWIPLSGTDAKGVPMKRYPGQLVRVQSRTGLPLMISRTDNRPKYFGKESVTIPKKFNLVEIATAEGEKLSQRYAQHFAELING